MIHHLLVILFSMSSLNNNSSSPSSTDSSSPSTAPENRLWLNPEEQELWRSWVSSHASLTAALAKELSQRNNLSLAEYEVLVHLSEAPDHRVRIVALSETMHWERSRLSHQLTRMTKKGLVFREECTADKRGAYAVLTDEGLRTIQESAPGHAAAVRTFFLKNINPEDYPTLIKASQAILRGINDPSKSIPES